MKLLDRWLANYSDLKLISDSAQWVLDYEQKKLKEICQELGVNVLTNREGDLNRRECIYYSSQFVFSHDELFNSKNRVAVDYFHGQPHQEDAFRVMYDGLKRNSEKVWRVRVSQSVIEQATLAAGVPRERVFRITIPIDDKLFHLTSAEDRKQQREALGIPQSAFVIGSFLKDGNGWEEGLEPKLVKGPDIFLKTIAAVKAKIPELFVLLSGPARGYVKKGLTEMNVPFKHCYFEGNDGYEKNIPKYFNTLDAYLMSSREEGGPKAILESLASGIPLVTTKVGMAVDLIQDGVNALLAENEDFEKLANDVLKVYENNFDRVGMLERGRKTAEENSYTSSVPKWKEFFTGYVNF